MNEVFDPSYEHQHDRYHHTYQMKPLFGQVSEPVSVRDEQGNVLGFLTPMRQATKEDYEWARQQFTEQELEAARREPGGFTTQEVLEHLNRLSR